MLYEGRNGNSNAKSAENFCRLMGPFHVDGHIYNEESATICDSTQEKGTFEAKN